MAFFDQQGYVVLKRWDKDGNPLPTLPRGENVTLSPDAKSFATSDATATTVWYADGTPRATLPNSADVWNLQFSADGKTLIGLDTQNDRLKLWRLDDTYQEIPVTVDVNYWENRFTISPDGSRIVMSDGEALLLYQEDGTPLLTLEQSQLPLID